VLATRGSEAAISCRLKPLTGIVVIKVFVAATPYLLFLDNGLALRDWAVFL
jgi:hypothetical protein